MDFKSSYVFIDTDCGLSCAFERADPMFVYKNVKYVELMESDLK